ncbi:MAG: hypothetical protein RSG77_19495 [Hafnia sp.]
MVEHDGERRDQVDNEDVRPRQVDGSNQSADDFFKEEDGVFPAQAWAVHPKVFRAQLSSPWEAFIRLLWAPFLLFGAVYAQSEMVEVGGGWGLLGLLVTLPMICWSCAAILFSNEYRRQLTKAFKRELPAFCDLGMLTAEVLSLMIRGIFHAIVTLLRIIT